MLLRLAHARGFVLLSPSRAQVRASRAPECVPLILEPHSALYTDPVVVLDFQSLYPSVVMAHNYCFSTCLGKVRHGFPKGVFPPPRSSEGLEVCVCVRAREFVRG